MFSSFIGYDYVLILASQLFSGSLRKKNQISSLSVFKSKITGKVFDPNLKNDDNYGYHSTNGKETNNQHITNILYLFHLHICELVKERKLSKVVEQLERLTWAELL